MDLSQVLITIFFLFFLVSQGNSTTDMIEQSCKTCAGKSRVLNYNLCVSSLNNSPIAPPPPTNLSSLALVPMLQALDNATATASTIQELLDSSGRGFRRTCLRDCLELYDGAAERLAEAVRVFISTEDRGKTYSTSSPKSIRESSVMVTAAMEAAVTCENGFGERDDGEMTWTSPIGGENYMLFELGEIALCIINLLSSVTSLPF